MKNKIEFKETKVWQVMRSGVICIGEVYKREDNVFYFVPGCCVGIDQKEIRQINAIMETMK